MDKEYIFVAVLVVASLLGGYWVDKESCTVKSQSFEGVKYSLVGGCMVKHDGKWLPIGNIRGFYGG